MTTINLADLRAKYEAVDIDRSAYYSGRLVESTKDFLLAAHAAFPELLAMAEQAEKRESDWQHEKWAADKALSDLAALQADRDEILRKYRASRPRKARNTDALKADLAAANAKVEILTKAFEEARRHSLKRETFELFEKTIAIIAEVKT